MLNLATLNAFVEDDKPHCEMPNLVSLNAFVEDDKPNCEMPNLPDTFQMLHV